MFYVVTPEIKKAMEEERKRKMAPRPVLKEIVHLGIKTAIAEVEKAEKKIFSRSGVWNDYSLTTKERAISAIEKCGYGADIYIDEGKNIYVSMPCQSDMW